MKRIILFCFFMSVIFTPLGGQRHNHQPRIRIQKINKFHPSPDRINSIPITPFSNSIVLIKHHTSISPKINIKLNDIVPDYSVSNRNIVVQDTVFDRKLVSPGETGSGILKRTFLKTTYVPHQLNKIKKTQVFLPTLILILAILLIIAGVIFFVLSVTSSVSIGLIQPFLAVGISLFSVGILAILLLIFFGGSSILFGGI